jgi:hypothetical protein
MLDRDQVAGIDNWKEWTVAQTPQKRTADQAPDHLCDGNQHFEEWWDVPFTANGHEIRLRVSAVMGDGQTEDEWYPHLVKHPWAPAEEPEVGTHLVHVRDLSEGQAVYLAPSTFDFEFLDTTARRFEIAYDEEGLRCGRPTRPYLLDEIDSLQNVWTLVSKRLTTSQWMALDGLVEAKRREWKEPRGAAGEYSDAFERFVSDTLLNAKWNKKLDGQELDLLEKAALQGILNDAIDFYHEAIKEKGED